VAPQNGGQALEEVSRLPSPRLDKKAIRRFEGSLPSADGMGKEIVDPQR